MLSILSLLSLALCNFILESAPIAKKIQAEEKYVSASQLSDIIENMVKSKFNRQQETNNQRKGKEAHDKMLKKLFEGFFSLQWINIRVK